MIKAYELSKSDGGHYITAPVLIPNVVDRQGDTISEAEIEKAIEGYNASKQRVFKDHKSAFSEEEASVVESYAAPADFYIGSTRVPRGSWICKFRVCQELYDRARRGEILGFSIAGTGQEE